MASIKPRPQPPWLHYMGRFWNKTNATFHSNISSLIEEEWDKMSVEFILKAYNSFPRHVNTILEKVVAILSKFTVLCVLFCGLFF